MSFHFIKAGMQTSIQDLGRQGLMHLGISRSGAMDSSSLKMANWLVNKPPNSATIEVTLVGPTIQFECAMAIAICGATFELLLNNEAVYNNEIILVKKDDVLTFKKRQSGARAYIAFTGKLKLEPVLGSYSAHLTANLGSAHNPQLNDGDRIEVFEDTLAPYKQIPKQYQTSYSGNFLLRCVDSVESQLFSSKQLEQFFSQRYQVTPDCNRMGVRLSGKPIKFDKELEITSSGLTQGSIQIPPSGQAIISSVDGQTIGGYPRIANMISADLPILGQLAAGDQINFTQVEQKFAKASVVALQDFHAQFFNAH